MQDKINSENFWELYEKLPEKIQNILFDESVGLNLDKICRRHHIEEKFDELMNLITQSLMGFLPVDMIEDAIIRKVGLKKEVAEEINRELNGFVFIRVKDELNKLYGETMIVSEAEKKIKSEVEKKDVITQDAYREKIE